MRRVTCWNDLAPYGLTVLTGEACGLSFRLLFDVTEQGRSILETCFGIPGLRLSEPWNRGSPSDPAVGSILLSQEMFIPVAIFAMLESGCTEVWRYANGYLLGVERNDPPDQVDAARRLGAPELVRSYAYRGTAGDRNIHCMSGRIV